MGRLTYSLPIDATVEAVFAYVDDYRNTTKYMRDLAKWEPAGAVTHGKGARFAVAMKAGPVNIDGVVEMIDWKSESTIAWKSISGLKQSGRWTFEPGRDTCTVTLDAEFELPGGIAGRVMARAAEPILRSNLERSVKALKEQTEKAANAAPRAKTKAAAKG